MRKKVGEKVTKNGDPQNHEKRTCIHTFGLEPVKGLVKDVYIKEFRCISTSRHPRMPRRGLAGPEMKFLDVFC